MTTHPTLTREPAVMPVVDYEPPARAVPHCSSVNQSPVAQPHHVRPPRSPAGGPAHPAPAASPTLRAAAAFADAALRRVLEVLDHRRPAAALNPLLATGLVESVLSARPTGAGHTGAATLRRLRLQLVGAADPPTAAEVFGTYHRGPRVHAVACRIQRLQRSGDPGWQVVALHIG